MIDIQTVETPFTYWQICIIFNTQYCPTYFFLLLLDLNPDVTQNYKMD